MPACRRTARPTAATGWTALPLDGQRCVGCGQELAVVHAEHVGIHLHICRVYAAVGVVVPVFGLATAGSLGVRGDTWLIVSIVLTALAAAVLVLFVLSRQVAIVADLGSTATIARKVNGCSGRLAARPCTPASSTSCGPWSRC